MLFGACFFGFVLDLYAPELVLLFPRLVLDLYDLLAMSFSFQMRLISDQATSDNSIQSNLAGIYGAFGLLLRFIFDFVLGLSIE